MRLHFAFEEKKLIFSGLILWPGDDLHLITQWVWLHKCPFPSMTNTSEHFPTLRKNPTLEQKSVDCALANVHPWKPALGSLLLPPPPASPTTGVWEPGCPLSCSWSRQSVFLRVNSKEDTWTDVFEQPSLLRSLPCRFPKSWCACGFYNEEGFVCWRIFSALLLNSKVRRGWGQDENYSPLPSQIVQI